MVARAGAPSHLALFVRGKRKSSLTTATDYGVHSRREDYAAIKHAKMKLLNECMHVYATTLSA